MTLLGQSHEMLQTHAAFYTLLALTVVLLMGGVLALYTMLWASRWQRYRKKQREEQAKSREPSQIFTESGPRDPWSSASDRIRTMPPQPGPRDEMDDDEDDDDEDPADWWKRGEGPPV